MCVINRIKVWFEKSFTTLLIYLNLVISQFMNNHDKFNL